MAADIVRVGPGELDLFARVGEDVFDAAVDRGLLETFIATPGHLMVVAVADGAIVGQARGMIHRNPDRPDELYVDNLGVAPAARRQGLGRRLMAELIAWGREAGAGTAWVATETDNLPAVVLYRSLGAQPASMAYFEYDLD